MDDLVFVQVCNSTDDLGNDLSCVLFSQEHTTIDVFVDLTQQISTLAQFCNDEETLAILEDLLETQDVGMIEMLQQESHRHELVDYCVFHHLLLQDADSSLVFRTYVLAYSDFSVLSLADLHANAVVVHELVGTIKHPICLLSFHA